MPNIELYIVLLVICLVFSAFFSGSETAFISLQRFRLKHLVNTRVKGAEKVAGMIDEVFAGISGLKGLHCCGNTDWSVLLKTKLDILNFDTYNYAESVSIYPDEIRKFLARGGCIAWGIVPNDVSSADKETVASLRDRLEEAMAPFTRNGVRFKDLVAHSLLTPSCTLIPLGEEGAEKALELLTDLSREMRKRYGM